jgi:hypothetical protein
MSRITRTAAFAALSLLTTSMLWSQTPVAPRPAPQRRVQPCWQVAGISKTAMQERAAIANQTRSQIAAVCADTSLTPQQRREQIQQIHSQAKQKEEGLVSSSQQEALQACQKQRAGAHPPAAGLHHGGNPGPCGEFAAVPTGHPNPPNGQPQNQNTPNEENASPQN